MTQVLARLRHALAQPVDAAGLAAFRVLFGLLMCAGVVRFMASGWIEKFYREPSFFFSFWGFDWVRPWPVAGMYVHYAGLAVLALCVALGFYYRVAIALFFVGFSWTLLLDVTNYLNHYVLVALLALLMCFMPLGQAYSLDARRRPGEPVRTMPAWVLWLLRFQVGVVYVHAGLAKAGVDWLVHAQPLNLWFAARTELPLVGPLLAEPWVAYAASWFGFVFDTTIVGFLLWSRSRPLAYLVLLGFHTMTHVLFNIGMFPFIMTVAALVFFPPDWPRRLAARVGRRPTAQAPTPAARPHPVLSRFAFTVLAAYVAFQALFPFRHFLYPGDVLWNEEGMRFAWKVMLREKHGSVTYHVRFPDGRTLQVEPRRYLSSRQEREMSAQPDLILQLAHRIADDFSAKAGARVQVHAETLVSLNGRAPSPLIDPAVDLASIDDSLLPSSWILPAPSTPPRHVRALAKR